MKLRRSLQAITAHHLARGKSILLLGPRQTGKTTLVADLGADLTLSLVSPRERQRYERDPSLLAGEVQAVIPRGRRRPLVVIDEVQKVPSLLDVAQDLVDRRRAHFVLTGSSARKLRRRREVNLLPGRVVALRLDPLCLEELQKPDLDDLLEYGSLPSIHTTRNRADRDVDLRSYVETYLEEEIRQEALVRNVGAFSRFLELAALESGHIVNHSRISQDVGVSDVTVRTYFEILCDCLIAERVEPVTKSATRKRLSRSPRSLFFDLGVRRAAGREGVRPHPERRGELFEQLIGLEILRWCRLHLPAARLRFWRDPDGPEVDWVIEHEGRFLPVEVKLTDRPSERDTRHLAVFAAEYDVLSPILVCTVPRPMRIGNALAIPWTHLPQTLEGCLRTARRGRNG